MKKLMTTIAAVVMAACANAAVVNWDNGNGDIYLSDGTGLATGYIAYLFDNSVYAQATFVDDFKAGNIDLSQGYESDGLADDGWLEASDVGDFAAGDRGLYVVVFDAGTAALASNVFVSDVETVNFKASGVGSNVSFDLSSSESTASWTSIGGEVIPEPTSGLLLLVGMAGLALRRKQA